MKKFINNTLWKQIVIPMVLSIILVLVFQSVALASSSVLKVGSRGSSVRWLQTCLKDKGYLKSRPDGIYGIATKKAVMQFQDDNGIVIDGEAGPNTQKLLSMSNEVLSSTVTQNASNNIYWPAVNKVFRDYAVIIDVATGMSFTVKRLGGRLHADVEPLTSEDTAIFKQIVGHWTWDRRPVMVDIDNQIFPASVNAMPHHPQRIRGNDFDGHFCVHFVGSRIHKTGRSDQRHQQMIVESEKFIDGEGDNLRKYIYRGAMMLANRGVRLNVLPVPIYNEPEPVVETGVLVVTENVKSEPIKEEAVVTESEQQQVTQYIKEEEVSDVQNKDAVAPEQPKEEDRDSLSEVQGLLDEADLQGQPERAQANAEQTVVGREEIVGEEIVN